MSESLVFKQLHPSGRRSYRKSNSYSKMAKSKKSKTNSDVSQSHSNTSLCDESIGNNSIDNSIDFSTNKILQASTPCETKSNGGHINESKNRDESTEQGTNSSSQVIGDFISNYKITCITILMLLIGLIPLFNSSTYEKPIVNIKELKEKFPNQPNETWLYFETVIDDILLLKAAHPAVFLLLYTKANNEVNILIEHLAKYASTKLETNEDYIYVNKKEFHSKEAIQDYGFLIDKYEQDLIKKKVMVVEDLQEIPGKVAQAFHTLCDEISPLVDKVVYIFTLKVDSLDGKEEKLAETYLKKFWNDLDNDLLMPLITRVTSTVIKIVN